MNKPLIVNLGDNATGLCQAEGIPTEEGA